MAQLQGNVEALSKIRSADKLEIVEATFKWLLEEQLELQEDTQERKDAQKANSIRSTMLAILIC